jgi:hypothetical protein
VRFEELSLRVSGEELRLRFHDRVTVLSGLGAPERQALVDGLLGALDGRECGAGLTYVDGTGLRVTLRVDDDGRVTSVYDDGSAAPDLLADLGLDAQSVHELIHLRAADVGLLAGTTGNESPELADARASLAELTKQYDAAAAANHAVDAMREELTQIDDRLREVENGRAKRRYARLLGELEGVRAEWAALRGGDALASADARFLEDSDRAIELESRWRQARDQLEASTLAFGNRQRLDPRTIDEARAVPDAVPVELDALARKLGHAEARRDALHAQLNAMAASRLPDPSDPAVVRLARGDQDAVWTAAQRAIDTSLAIEHESMALGGLETEGVAPAIADDIERAHSEVEDAEALIERRKIVGYLVSGMATAAAAVAVMTFALIAPFALLAAVGAAYWAIGRPRHQLRSAIGREAGLLTRASVPTYRAFHMRRIDVVIDPTVRERLNLAALEHRVALGQWHELAGDLDPAKALVLEDEVRRYAASLAQLDGAADEIEALRAELCERAEPAAEQARAELLAACRPFGIDDPNLAVDMVRHQVLTAATARLQVELERAEVAEAAARAESEALLERLSIDPGDPEERRRALTEARQVARDRIEARIRARDRDEVEAELTKLEAQARREYRPEWDGTITAADAEEPDADDLVRRRTATADALVMAQGVLPDVGRLADRRAALERRVAVLEVALGDAFDANLLLGTGEIERLLMNRMVVARNAGAKGESLPVLLNDPFIKIRGEKKWEVLDLIERLSERVQVVYLTDDPDVMVWARRRMGSGCLTLLEPVSESTGA